jgi:hypothetical protein
MERAAIRTEAERATLLGDLGTLGRFLWGKISNIKIIDKIFFNDEQLNINGDKFAGTLRRLPRVLHRAA